jgi:hypothetical protein
MVAVSFHVEAMHYEAPPTGRRRPSAPTMRPADRFRN